MGNARPVAERNVAAEARAVEEGHHARVQDDGSVKVTSDTHGDLGKWYRVEYVAHMDGLISFSCRPGGPMAYRDDHLAASSMPGSVPCKHAALAARRLEREGLARYDDNGRWSVDASMLEAIRAKIEAQMPEDPFEGLPRY